MLGEWLTHGDLALEAKVDFLAVVEHRLIPARARSEWDRLKRKGCCFYLGSGCQDSSHVGNAGVGVLSMRDAPVALPSFATAQLKWFFDCRRAVRCMLPLGAGRFMHLVVLYGYQGADTDAEQLASTEQLFDAAFGELSVVGRRQPCMLVCDFNVEPTKIPCLAAKGISAGLWVDFEEAWALTSGLQPAPTCKRNWGATGGHRRDLMVGCPLAAAVLYCNVQPNRWIAPNLAVRTLFDCCRWSGRVTQPVPRTPLWPASWLSVVDKGRGSKSVEVRNVWEVYDDRLQFISWQDAQRLSESLDADDVSRAWLVWSGAAEAALADAFRFSGGPVPSRGLALGRGSAFFRVVQLGGPLVRSVRGNVADAVDGPDVFLYRDSSIAPSLVMRRRFICILSPWNDFIAVWGSGLGDFHHAVYDVHHRLSDFIHQVVVHRRGEAIGGWRNWIREDPMLHPHRWLRPDLVPPAPFLQCEPHLTPGGSGVLADPARVDEEFRKAWLPYFCRSGQRETSIDEFDHEVGRWLPLLPEVSLPRLTGRMLADVVQRKGSTAGGLDGWGWGWRELKVLPVSWHDELARTLSLRLRMLAFGLMGCWMLTLP